MDIGKTPTEHLHWQRLQSIISRVDPNHIYTVYIRYFWLENHQMYGHIRRTYTVLANPNNIGNAYTALYWHFLQSIYIGNAYRALYR